MHQTRTQGPSSPTLRRNWLGALGALALACSLPLSSWAQTAQSYPNKPIRLVVPFAPGGAADILGRLIADRLQKDLGQAVIIVNRDGGGTIIGADFVAKSPADGYTLLLGNDAATINSGSGRKLPYDLIKDFAPLSLVYSGPQVILVNKNSPFNSLSDLVKAGKAQGEKLRYGSSGIGSSTHLSTANFGEAAGIKPTHVPYRGIAPAINDLQGGHVDFLVAGSSSALPLIRGGNAKPLAILSKTRSSLMPQVPTAIEQGVNAESAGWYGVLAPAGTPDDIVQKLSNTLTAAVANPEFREKLLALAGDPQGLNAAQFGQFIRSEVQRFGNLIRTHDIQLQ
jgi:tripartite-type tricarboxylate transporter receptor subunit TctC